MTKTMINRWIPAVIAGALFLLLTSAGCRNTGKNEPTKDTSLVLQQSKTSKKWKVDAPTLKNFAEIKATINGPALQKNNYTAMAVQLEKNINTLVSECRMKGEAHEALHAWLEQLITDVKSLKKESSDQPSAFNKIRQDVQNFEMQFS
jgi:hypothetical protein